MFFDKVGFGVEEITDCNKAAYEGEILLFYRKEFLMRCNDFFKGVPAGTSGVALRYNNRRGGIWGSDANLLKLRNCKNQPQSTQRNAKEDIKAFLPAPITLRNFASFAVIF